MFRTALVTIGVLAIVGCTRKETIYCDDHPTDPICADGSTGCTGNAQCTTATASRCDTSTSICKACEQNSDCSHISGKGLCSAGKCVQCTEQDESACGDYVCLPTDGNCSPTIKRGMTGNCVKCETNTQCQENHDCVPMNFQGAFYGNYCLQRVSAPTECEFKFQVTTEVKKKLFSSTDAAGTTYCSINEMLTTCEAVVAFNSDCGDAGPTACAPEGKGAVCEEVGGMLTQCSYPCTDEIHCGDTIDCPTVASDAGVRYCGRPTN